MLQQLIEPLNMLPMFFRLQLSYLDCIHLQMLPIFHSTLSGAPQNAWGY